MHREDVLRLASTHDAAQAAQAAFAIWRDRLRRVLPIEADIAHVGATAVAGCVTKGDLDIAIRVAPKQFAAASEALAALFVRNPGSDRTEHFAAFKDDTADPPLGLQLVVRGTPLDVFVRFRDRLTADPGLVARYNALKRSFEGADMDVYRQAKSAFIEAVLGSRS